MRSGSIIWVVSCGSSNIAVTIPTLWKKVEEFNLFKNSETTVKFLLSSISAPPPPLQNTRFFFFALFFRYWDFNGERFRVHGGRNGGGRRPRLPQSLRQALSRSELWALQPWPAVRLHPVCSGSARGNVGIKLSFDFTRNWESIVVLLNFVIVVVMGNCNGYYVSECWRKRVCIILGEEIVQIV